MTVTTLEPTVIDDHDLAVACGTEGCPATAERVVRNACGCVNLWCAPCTGRYIAMMASWLPISISCARNANWHRFIHNIGEFVVSVHPL